MGLFSPSIPMCRVCNVCRGDKSQRLVPSYVSKTIPPQFVCAVFATFVANCPGDVSLLSILTSEGTGSFSTDPIPHELQELARLAFQSREHESCSLGFNPRDRAISTWLYHADSPSLNETAVRGCHSAGGVHA